MTGRIPILDVQPAVDCGRLPAKAVAGETLEVSATVFRDGHDAVNCNVALRGPRNRKGPWTPMRLLAPGTDRWAAEITPDAEGKWTFTIEAWADPFATWCHDAQIKVPSGIDVELMLTEGAQLLRRAADNLPARGANSARRLLRHTARTLRDTAQPPQDRLGAALAPEIRAILDRHPLRELLTRSDPMPLQVDRVRALYGSWYEFFPRSEGASLDPPRSGTFRTAMERLPAIAAMCFDVVYLPPVHPVGVTFRKGPNNSLTPGTDDPGVPWAIGSEDGGHDAIHPDLGTMEDFRAFAGRARDLGMEVALDFALQASPDHPWVKEHPEWFSTRADGTIAYAENPPKKYQDIYPLNFDNDPKGLYAECLRIVRHWIANGVRIFRVDNPHTKPVQFWEWLLARVRKTDPDVIFLAEAFTRPPMLHQLAKVGFHQSYTYFTWRNKKWEIEEYLRELSGPTVHFLRPNFFVNTPDILHEYLQHGGHPAFKIRAVLASMLSPTWGVYSGYELFEHVARRPGSEEYLDSEKYQYRPRDWEAAEREGRTLAPYITRLNAVRRRHKALQRLRNLRFHHADNDAMVVFSKAASAVERTFSPESTAGLETGTAGTGTAGTGTAGTGTADCVLVVVSLDPHVAQEATVSLDMPGLGMDWNDTFMVHDEITGASYRWGQVNYVRLDPFHEPAHIFTVRRDIS